MIIKKVAFGNYEEAFIEENFENKVNIIFSNDNNKGKTLLIQGLMFSLGNVPIFPSGFDHNNYYFYSMVDIGGKSFEFLRWPGLSRPFSTIFKMHYSLKQYKTKSVTEGARRAIGVTLFEGSQTTPPFLFFLSKNNYFCCYLPLHLP